MILIITKKNTFQGGSNECQPVEKGILWINHDKVPWMAMWWYGFKCSIIPNYTACYSNMACWKMPHCVRGFSQPNDLISRVWSSGVLLNSGCRVVGKAPPSAVTPRSAPSFCHWASFSARGSGSFPWLAGKSTINGAFNGKITCKWDVQLPRLIAEG